MSLKSLATLGGVATLVVTGAFANVKPAAAVAPSGILNFAGNVSYTSNSFTFLDTPVVAPTSTGTFAGLVGSTVGIQNVTPNATDIPSFVTVDGYTFDLQGFSASNIQQSTSANGQLVATVATSGTWNSSTGGTSIGAGTFTAQVTTPTTYSASITATPSAVPEPSETFGILTLGSLGGMFVIRNRKRFVNF